MSTTKRFTANTTYQSAATGPLNMMINIEDGFLYMSVGTSAPADDENSMLLRFVAGENYVNLTLETGDNMYVRALRDTSVISWVESAPAA